MHTQRWLVATISMLVAAIGLGVVLQGLGESSTGPAGSDANTVDDQTKTYRRIVSLSPSITESLFALGLGDRVVGVTDFCDYPPEAATKSKVGGYYDLNYEAIMTLNPDLVICLPEHHQRLPELDRLGLKHLTVDHRRVETIIESLTSLGQACGATEKARVLVEDIQNRIEAVKQRFADKKRPRVLISVGRDVGTTVIDRVYVAGRDGLYDEMIALAGGVNAYEGELAFPVVSGEGLLRLDPDIIIDMVADLEQKGLSVADVLAQWESLGELSAVRERQVFPFTEDFVTIPGPRFILVLEKMAAVIHPEACD